jgi:hypothetical protein
VRNRTGKSDFVLLAPRCATSLTIRHKSPVLPVDCESGAKPIGFSLIKRDRPDKFPYVKAIQFLPLAFLADVHGFIYFVPYMLFVLVIAQMVAIARRRKVSKDTVGVPSIVPVDTGDVVLAVVRN